jgi:hypothetical protein
LFFKLKIEVSKRVTRAHTLRQPVMIEGTIARDVFLIMGIFLGWDLGFKFCFI